MVLKLELEKIRQLSKQSPVIGIATSMGGHGKCRLQLEPMTRLTEVSFQLCSAHTTEDQHLADPQAFARRKRTDQGPQRLANRRDLHTTSHWQRATAALLSQVALA